MAVVRCEDCGAANDLPVEALRRGQYRCHACGETNLVPLELQQPHEQAVPLAEPVQAQPNYVPSPYNNPESMRQAEAEASRLGCLVALLGIGRGG